MVAEHKYRVLFITTLKRYRAELLINLFVFIVSLGIFFFLRSKGLLPITDATYYLLLFGIGFMLHIERFPIPPTLYYKKKTAVAIDLAVSIIYTISLFEIADYIYYPFYAYIYTHSLTLLIQYLLRLLSGLIILIPLAMLLNMFTVILRVVYTEVII
ncbi:MAG: hypothetical protein GXO26_03675 [Crenarchaeota archaeon]|nr:hypothetical protein [Thermoproteota archaeon]